MSFKSEFKKLKLIKLPKFTGIRVMMMPITIGDMSSIPEVLKNYKEVFQELFALAREHKGKTGYITIDEKVVKKGETHRRAGAHVDGVFNGSCGGWGGGSGGGWGSHGNGMITIASHEGCLAFNQDVKGFPGNDGECDHLKEQLKDGTVFQANTAYWVDGLCVHESLPMQEDTARTFLRLSLPSDAPWFEGYTENPLGIKPSGPVLPRRKFM